MPSVTLRRRSFYGGHGWGQWVGMVVEWEVGAVMVVEWEVGAVVEHGSRVRGGGSE